MDTPINGSTNLRRAGWPNTSTNMALKVVYYEGFLGRAGAVCMMLAEKDVQYEYTMEPMATMGNKGGPTNAFAPPCGKHQRARSRA